MLAFRHHQRKKNKARFSKSHLLLDKSIYFIALIGPIMTIPQILNVWIVKQTDGLSIYTWGSYFLINIVWLYYGLVHRDKAIMFSSILWMIANGLVFLGIIFA